MRKLFLVEGVKVATEAPRRTPLVHRFLRPPGALLEPSFLRTCTRCDLCVGACPEGIIVRATHPMEAPGSPVVELALGACTHCMKCVEACPEGALLATEDLRMGTAVVHDETCLSSVEIRCTACVEACPLGERAIRTRPEGGIAVLAEACTGCGFCMRACPTDPRSISVQGRSAVPLPGHPPPPRPRGADR